MLQMQLWRIASTAPYRGRGGGTCFLHIVPDVTPIIVVLWRYIKWPWWSFKGNFFDRSCCHVMWHRDCGTKYLHGKANHHPAEVWSQVILVECDPFIYIVSVVPCAAAYCSQFRWTKLHYMPWVRSLSATFMASLFTQNIYINKAMKRIEKAKQSEKRQFLSDSGHERLECISLKSCSVKMLHRFIF